MTQDDDNGVDGFLRGERPIFVFKAATKDLKTTELCCESEQ